VLTRTGFCNDALGAELLREKRLPDRVVDLVRARGRPTQEDSS
jgi:hypothetical protein